MRMFAENEKDKKRISLHQSNVSKVQIGDELVREIAVAPTYGKYFLLEV